MREAVRWFAQQMETKLREHDDRGGWHQCEQGWLLARLTDEAVELMEAIKKSDHEAVISEAADVANFAMMIADKAREA
jgi:NTP pyrophosphatase (non-canonical NTP hydrolase)